MLLTEYLLEKPELQSLLKQSEMLLSEYLLGKKSNVKFAETI